MCRFLAPFLAGCFLLLVACGGGSGGGGGTAGDLFTDDDVPNEPVSAEITLDSGSASMATDELVVSLEDGSQLTVPAGALPSGGELELAAVDNAAWFSDDGDDVRRVVLAVEGVSLPTADWTLSVPMRDGEAVRGGRFDPEAATCTMQPLSVVDDGAGNRRAVLTVEGMLTLQARSLAADDSKGYWLIEFFSKPTPPASRSDLVLPYYAQGESEYCWAASVCMAAQAARFSSTHKTSDIIGRMGVSEEGITMFQFRWSSSLRSILWAYTGVFPERKVWGELSSGSLKSYLKEQIGIHGRPVVVHHGGWSHAVLVVGYDGDSFRIHDPQGTAPTAIGYTERAWSAFESAITITADVATLVLPKALDADRSAVTIAWMPSAAKFVHPSSSINPTSKQYVYRWDAACAEGHGFGEVGEASLDRLPGDVGSLVDSGDALVVNASPTASHEVLAMLTIFRRVGDGYEIVYDDDANLSVGPNSAKAFPWPTVPVADFHDERDSATTYHVRALISVDGKRRDEDVFTVVLEPRPVVLDALEPAGAAAGDTIALTGSGFGAVAEGGRVSFTGVEVAAADVVSWQDERIVVTVPSAAESGPVTVSVGSQTSAAQTLTMSDSAQTTLTGSFDLIEQDEGYLTFPAFTGTWSLTGVDPWKNDNTQLDDHYHVLSLSVARGSSGNVSVRVPWTGVDNGEYIPEPELDNTIFYSSHHLLEEAPTVDEFVVEVSGDATGVTATPRLSGTTLELDFDFGESDWPRSLNVSYQVSWSYRTNVYKEGTLTSTTVADKSRFFVKVYLYEDSRF